MCPLLTTREFSAKIVGIDIASPRLWNQLPDSFHQPRPHLSPSDSSLFPDHVSLPVSASPLSPSITPVLFHSRLKTFLPTLHRPLVPSGLISWITWLFVGFPCSTGLFLFQFFFHFQFSKSFSSSVIFSSLLLSTPIYSIIGLFLAESASL